MSSDQAVKICFWIASFVKNPEILKRVKEEFGITIHSNAVDYYKRNENWKKIIEAQREKWSAEIHEIELVNKRRRLEEIEKIFHKCVASGQMKTALAAAYQIQGEVEKVNAAVGHQTNYQINIFKDMSEAELEEERLKSLERLKTLKGELTCLAVERVESESQESKETV